MSALLDENTQFVDSDGKPLVNGKLYIGVKGLDPINNLITIYANRSLSTVISNPQILDENGRTTNKIWVPGLYSFRVDNTNDVQQLQDLDAGNISVSGTTNLFDVQGTDSITAIGSPTISSYVNGEIYVFQAANNNTGATTLNIDNLGAKTITKAGLSLTADILLEGLTYTAAYNEENDNFDLLGVSDVGATGGGNDKVFLLSAIDVTEDYTIPTGHTAITGNLRGADGVTVSGENDSRLAGV